MHLKKSQLAIGGAVLGLLALAVQSLHATPYASSTTNDSGNVSFVLNENADSVKVIFDGGGVGNTNDLPTTKGSHSFSLGAHTSWEIHVTKSSPQMWTQISDDNNVFNNFYSPRSAAVNRNPASPYFGRVYVLENANGTSSGTTEKNRTVNKGIYALNADLSDALGQGDTGLTGGLENFDILTTAVNSAFEPWKIVVGEDDHVYVSDALDPRGGLARMDANLQNGELVLAGVGNTARPDLHTVIYGIKVTGSTNAGTLSVLGIDGQWSGGANYLLRWNISSGPLPSETAPTPQFRAGIAAEQSSEIDVDPITGNIFVQFYRDTVVAGVPGLQVFSPSGTQLYTSVSGSTDAFRLCRSTKVSPDGSKLAILRNDRSVVLLGLTNGVPDLSNSNLLAAFPSASSTGYRTLDWDAAGNLYVGDNITESLRVFSPGGTKTAVTRSSGTFELVTPQTIVSVAASTSTANEGGPNGVFTVTRTGDTSGPLTVNYTVSGTATAGSDYTTLPGSVTFQAGASSTNISVVATDDPEIEFTEPVILTIDGSLNYSISTGTATVNILDNEPATITLAPTTSETRLLEGYSAQKLGFTLTRKGLISSALTVNIGYSGTATPGTDFNGPATVPIAANAATAAFSITPIDDDNYEGNETLDVTITSGSGYTVGAPAVANVTIIEDDYPAGTVLFSDNFDTDSSGLWTVNAFDSTYATATFAQDYSAYVPPSKPGGTTKGLVFTANLVASIPRNAISASPTSLSVSGDYRLRFKAWNNYNGPIAGGGPGSSYHLTGGVGTTGDHAQFSFGSADGIWFDMNGDGESTQAVGDTSAYAGIQVLTAEYGVYAAPGTVDTVDRPRQSVNPYYSIWGGIQAPASQVAAFPTQQSGTSDIGSFGISWHTVVIGHETNTVYWVIDGIPMASVPDNFAPLGPNIFVGWADNFNNTATSFPNPAAMSFGIIDDLRVETIAATPIIITDTKIVGGNVEVTFSGPAEEAPSNFRLQSSSTVSGIYTDDNTAAITSIGAGQFKATVSPNGDKQFYKIKL